ncbi:MAG: helix-turn-helix domain-containing protein [Parvibaculum sp.]|uniref:winged helix-turn-helix transcriptional regulator n=1 Tax=Parvibaculum sp. TaxID=2024848 RepID=UPI0032EC50D4
MRWEELDREPCSLARTLSVVGDRWTLLVLRECFLRIRRFEEFEQRLGIARHVLADRLKKLTEAGVLEKIPYQERPRREEYRLTEKGLALYPALLALLDWGDKYMSGKEGPPLLRRHKTCGHIVHAVPSCSECGEPLDARAMTVEAGPGAPAGFVAPQRPSKSAVDK